MAQSPIVSVRGTAELAVPPEIATINVAVLVRDRARAKTESRLVELSARIDAVIKQYADALRRHDTSAIAIYPVIRGRRTDKPESYDGRRSWTLQVRDFAVLPELLGAVTVDDAVRIDGPSWSVEPGSPAYRQVKVAAVADAVERARAYAAAFDASIEQLLEVADLGMSGGQGMARAFAASPKAATDSATIEQLDLEPVTQYVSGSIEARFTMSAPDLDAPVAASE